MSIILGIDPALQKTGWGVIQAKGNNLKFIDCGVISVNPKLPMPDRLLTLGNAIRSVIAKHKPDEAAIEETFVNKNPTSSLKLGHARGAIMLSVALEGIPTEEYAATLIKKSIVGTGRAEKRQIQMMVKQILPSADVSQEDAADALAVAICHFNHANVNKLMINI